MRVDPRQRRDREDQDKGRPHEPAGQTRHEPDLVQCMAALGHVRDRPTLEIAVVQTRQPFEETAARRRISRRRPSRTRPPETVSSSNSRTTPKPARQPRASKRCSTRPSRRPSSKTPRSRPASRTTPPASSVRPTASNSQNRRPIPRPRRSSSRPGRTSGSANAAASSGGRDEAEGMREEGCRDEGGIRRLFFVPLETYENSAFQKQVFLLHPSSLILHPCGGLDRPAGCQGWFADNLVSFREMS